MDLGIFNRLLATKPRGRPINDKGITKFVREHFDEFQAIRELFYSWLQIADFCRVTFSLESDNLPSALKSSFYKERKRRLQHGCNSRSH